MAVNNGKEYGHEEQGCLLPRIVGRALEPSYAPWVPAGGCPTITGFTVPAGTGMSRCCSMARVVSSTITGAVACKVATSVVVRCLATTVCTTALASATGIGISSSLWGRETFSFEPHHT